MGYIKDKFNKEPSSQAQRNKIIQMCVDNGLLDKTVKTTLQFTGPKFKEMFKLVFNEAPAGDIGWPSVTDWTDGLSLTQAKVLLNYLTFKYPRNGRDNFLFGSYRNGW